MLGWVVYLLTLARAILGLLFNAVWTPIWSCLAVAAGVLGWDEGGNFVCRNWGRGLVWFHNVDLEVRGRENFPDNRGAILVFNHQSFFDIYALYATSIGTVRFGAKIELFKIPFFGPAMRAIGTLPIVRENRSEVFKVYKAAEEKFLKGWKFVLAPEGTRQSEPVVGRFKKGPFIFAINAHVPIVPMVIKGTYVVMPKSSFLANVGKWRRKVVIEILEVVETQGKTLADAGELADFTQAQMAKAFALLP